MPTKATKPARKSAAKAAAKKSTKHTAAGGKIVVKKAVKKVVHKTALPKVEALHTVAMPAREAYQATVGRRKTAVARVRYYKLGTGEIVVNNLPVEKYFGYFTWQELAKRPLTIANWQTGRWSIKVHGGGIPAQAHAMAHGIARMLQTLDGDLRASLKKAGMLTRDARVKERKKYGLKRARRAPQWQKR